MSKMGVSTVASYVGSQLFEAVGISETVLARYFPGFTSRLGGITLEHIAGSVLTLHASAYAPAPGERVELRNNGEYQWRRDGEIHLFNPAPCKSCSTPRARSASIYQGVHHAGRRSVHGLVTLRGLMSLVPSATPLALDEVESTASIIKRFSTGAMSYGSISEEATAPSPSP